jgi:endonuclease/exonuclease/phosphatase family metal-dependent hydrolase
MLRASCFGFLALATALVVPACTADTSTPGAEEPTASEQEIVGAGKRICSWNVRKLGNQFDGKAKNIDLVQKVISANCDLVAIQEVMQTTGGGASGFDDLVKEMGTTYWGSLRTEQPRPNTTSSNSERYAWFWRKSVVSPCDGFTDARYITDTTGAFLRDPAYACFKMKAHAREIVLATYHALYGSEVERKREVALLDDDLDRDGKADDIFQGFRAARPGADVMMVGDFNLTPPQIKEALPTYKDMTGGAGSTLNSTNAITTNQYDHVLMLPDEQLANEVSPAKTLDVRSVATGNQFFETVSDHVPIQLILDSAARKPTTSPK